MRKFIEQDIKNINEVISKEGFKLENVKLIYGFTTDNMSDISEDDYDSNELYMVYVTPLITISKDGKEYYISIDGDTYADHQDLNNFNDFYEIYFERGYDDILMKSSDELDDYLRENDNIDKFNEYLESLANSLQNASYDDYKDFGFISVTSEYA